MVEQKFKREVLLPQPRKRKHALSELITLVKKLESGDGLISYQTDIRVLDERPTEYAKRRRQEGRTSS